MPVLNSNVAQYLLLHKKEKEAANSQMPKALSEVLNYTPKEKYIPLAVQKHHDQIEHLRSTSKIIAEEEQDFDDQSLHGKRVRFAEKL